MRLSRNCANCLCEFNSNLIVREIIISSGSKNPTWKSIKVNQVLSAVYKFDYLDQLPNIEPCQLDDQDEDDAEIAICGVCADLLTNLFKFHEELTSRRQLNSFVSNKIQRLDTILKEIQLTWSQMINGCTSGGGMSDDDEDESNDIEIIESTRNRIKTPKKIQFDEQIKLKRKPPTKINGNLASPIKMTKKSNESMTTPIKVVPKRVSTEMEPPKLTPQQQLTCSTTITPPQQENIPDTSEKIKIKREMGVKIMEQNIDGFHFNQEEDMDDHGFNGTEDMSMTLEEIFSKGFDDDDISVSDILGSCSFCDVSQLTSCDLAKHLLRVHTPKNSVTCIICKKDLAYHWYMLAHLQCHTGYKPHKCTKPGCSKAFTALCNLQRHLKSKHKLPTVPAAKAKVSSSSSSKSVTPTNNETVIETTKCPLCDLQHSSESDLADHLFYFHTDKDSVDCVLCHKNLYHRGPLKVHLLRHLGVIVGNGSNMNLVRKSGEAQVPPVKHAPRVYVPRFNKRKADIFYECPTCGKDLTSASALKVHMKIHGENTFDCQFCDYSTTESKKFTSHMRTHMTEQVEGTTSTMESEQEEELPIIENNLQDDNDWMDEDEEEIDLANLQNSENHVSALSFNLTSSILINGQDD